MVECSRPFWDLLARSVNEPDLLFDWVVCPYAITIGVPAVGSIVFIIGFVGLYNWTESWVVPMTWTGLVAPLVALSAISGGLLRLIGGVVTFAVAMVFFGVWLWYGRA